MSTQSLQVRVARKKVEALDICSFELVSLNRNALPAFTAGSHVDVRLPNGMTRQYSLCNDPAETHRYLIGVLKDPATRGGSRALHELVNAGDTLEIGAPKNHFPLSSVAEKHVLLAGGIGVTPILSMAERLARVGESFEMHYCARSRERAAFYDRIRQSAFASSVNFHFDDGTADQRLDACNVLGTPRPGIHLYACGPKGFLDWVLGTARAADWPEEQLHFEFFSAEVQKFDADGSFEVQLASSGRVVIVPGNKTVVQALSEAGIDVPVSCEQGVCGTCVTRVLQGEPEHRDMFFTPQEHAANVQFTPCCSRSKSARLVLDL